MTALDESKTYYRHRLTGDRGYLVERGDKTFIRLDRPAEVIERPFVIGEWIEEFELRNFTEVQMATVAFEADKKLCLFLGLPGEASAVWLNMSEQKRISFMREGPKAPAIRCELWESIMTVLRKYC